MIQLVHKSPSKVNIDDEEYNKMKRRILTIVNQSIQDEIFYEARFNVSNSIFKVSKFHFRLFLDL
jgi:hypothetical protein